MTSHTSRIVRFSMRSWLLAAVVATVLFGGVASASAFTVDPLKVISNDNMRDYNSMSEKQIQTFLETQPGPLKSLVTTDYAGVKNVKASTIIYRACQQWKINPKVMLTMLQKEQSLLTRTTLAKNTLSRAIGAGCPNTTTNYYPGFGKQMWYGARLLDGYGELKNGSTIKRYVSGIQKDIYKHATYGTKIVPKNLATYKLYVYNPSIPGNTNFGNIYYRYFGSPLASARYKPVYRFKNKSTGTYLYTTSVAEKVKMTQGSYKKRWAYEGQKFKIDTQASTKGTVPVYRFKNKKTGKQSYTSSKTTYKQRTSKAGKKTWKYVGVAFNVTRKKLTKDAVPIYKFYNRKTGANLLTHSKAAKDKLRSKKYKKKWRYEGVAYYLPRASTATTVQK